MLISTFLHLCCTGW